MVPTISPDPAPLVLEELYPESTWTITMCRIVPLTVEPDWVALLDTMTSISLGVEDGGLERLDVLLDQVDPHVRAPE
jgi:hypothetical protein